MSNHQQVTIVRDTAESNNEVDALAQAIAQQGATEEAQQPVAESRPGWLPEKFQNAEDMAKAYSELEKKIGTKTGITPDAFQKYSEEFIANGDLSDESVKAVSSLGIPEEIVRAYVEGQKAVMDANINSIYGMAGGEPQYQSMLEWAADVLPEAEVDAFNDIIGSGNMNTIRMAVQGLKARFEQSNGVKGRLIQGETSGSSGSAFRSIAEIVSAMKDPRYAKDPAYRQDVEQRVALSNALGVNR
ncbi:capsid assembly protein [uncultured Caudovirales phage]|uniref:Capsid assembly protein n=1 Tax=uncultured Caudovirales phage TaxID=2100421 RepID=A0A6J5M3Z7_9CAUD|nr:capsid assembly protein [uncultured Caudovirales phage]